jgi:hypothetical protein
MNLHIARLKELLGTKNYKEFDLKFNNKILLFESTNGLLLPPDLAEYFRLLDRTTDKIDANLYEFYAVDQFKSVKNGLAYWRGVPDYGNIVNTLEGCENCFVFADYMFHLFTYAIRLHQRSEGENEIYVICGDKYKIIAKSFSDFLDLYFCDSTELSL